MVVNGRRRAPTDIDCAKRGAEPDQAGPRGSQNHATARDIEQLAQMLDRVRLHRSLSNDGGNRFMVLSRVRKNLALSQPSDARLRLEH
jgi:hypothetical protein